MKTKFLLPFAIIAALPFAANATNISGDMYVAPQIADENHPAPYEDIGSDTTFGRVNIDTADQGHIATTAYVKGAYNTAIAAVNEMVIGKQDKLYNGNTGAEVNGVFGAAVIGDTLHDADMGSISNSWRSYLEASLPSTMAVVDGIKSQRVRIYTTWDDDTATATTLVPFETAQ